MDDELGDRGVEGLGPERQALGEGLLDVDARIARADRLDELRRRVDRGHGVGAEPPDELGRQGARPATDVEHLLPGLDPGEIRKLRGEMHRVPAHEPVVGIGCDVEAHS